MPSDRARPQPHRYDPSHNRGAEMAVEVGRGESYEDVRKRAIGAFESPLTKYSGSEIVIVSDAVVMLSVWPHIVGGWLDAHVPPIVLMGHDGRMRAPKSIEGKRRTRLTLFAEYTIYGIRRDSITSRAASTARGYVILLPEAKSECPWLADNHWINQTVHVLCI
jgi:Histidine phosphatase superfamily (branch 1)